MSSALAPSRVFSSEFIEMHYQLFLNLMRLSGRFPGLDLRAILMCIANKNEALAADCSVENVEQLFNLKTFLNSIGQADRHLRIHLNINDGGLFSHILLTDDLDMKFRITQDVLARPAVEQFDSLNLDFMMDDWRYKSVYRKSLEKQFFGSPEFYTERYSDKREIRIDLNPNIIVTHGNIDFYMDPDINFQLAPDNKYIFSCYNRGIYSLEGEFSEQFLAKFSNYKQSNSTVVKVDGLDQVLIYLET